MHIPVFPADSILTHSECWQPMRKLPAEEPRCLRPWEFPAIVWISEVTWSAITKEKEPSHDSWWKFLLQKDMCYVYKHNGWPRMHQHVALSELVVWFSRSNSIKGTPFETWKEMLGRRSQLPKTVKHQKREKKDHKSSPFNIVPYEYVLLKRAA